MFLRLLVVFAEDNKKAELEHRRNLDGSEVGGGEGFKKSDPHNVVTDQQLSVHDTQTGSEVS